VVAFKIFRNYITVLLLLFFLCFSPLSSVYSQSNSGRSGDDLTIKIAVMGPGDELYFWFGHIGLVVDDHITGRSMYYDWGVFSFDNEGFFWNFAMGRLIYSCAVSRAEANYNTYIRHNRSITLYTLDLPKDIKEKIVQFAENNVLPENRDYMYHLFRDNCATRIRDIIDMGLGGQLKAEFGNSPGRYTLRQHVSRHTWFSPFMDWALNFWMGQGIDGPITEWEEMFLPSEIENRIKNFRYMDGDGNERSLVSSTEIFHISRERPIVLEVPPKRWPKEFFVGLLFSSLLLVLFFLRKKFRAGRVIMGLLQSALGLFFGIMGSVLFFLTFFTNHDYAFHNSNVFFVNPLFLAVIPLSLIFTFSKNAKKRFVTARLLRYFWAYVLLGGLFVFAIKLSPDFYQQNLADLALVMPIAVTMIYIMMRLGSYKKL